MEQESFDMEHLSPRLRTIEEMVITLSKLPKCRKAENELRKELMKARLEEELR